MPTTPSYRRSGRIALRSLAVPPLALLASAALGVGYSFGSVYFPVAGLPTLLLLAACALGSAIVVELLAKWLHVRSRTYAVLVGLAVGVANVYFAWVGFAWALLSGEPSFALQDALHLAFLQDLVLEVNAQGWFSLWDHTPTGDWLWAAWAGEALALFAVPVWSSFSLPDRPYCEDCGAWTRPGEPVMTLGENPGADVQGAVERLDLAALAAFDLPSDGATALHVLEPHLCPACDAFATLSVVQVTVRRDGDGDPVEKRDPSPPRVVCRDDLAALAETAEAMRLADELG